MVVVKLREVYDLSTKKGEMSMIGVHTPSMAYLVRQYNGFFMNFSKFQFKSCDIRCACASTLPADPAQIGIDATDIAPQDMFNPILFRAVSNDSFDTMNSRLYSLGYFGSATRGGSADAVNSGLLPTGVDDFNVYYAILSNPHGWRTASPQAGFEMSNLKPLVWTQLYNTQAPYQDVVSIAEEGGTTTAHMEKAPTQSIWAGDTNSVMASRSLRGHAQPYPALPTFIFNGIANGQPFPDGDGAGGNIVGNRYPDTPTVFVAQIIIPPAKLNLLYYRMVVEWTIEFFDIRPTSDIMTLGSLNTIGDASAGFSYFTDYSIASSKSAEAVAELGSANSTVDVAKANIDLVMQS